MEANGGGSRQRWTEQRRRKEPTLYDEWLNDQKAALSAKSSWRQSLPLRQGDTASIGVGSSGTIRAVTPDEAANVVGKMDEESSLLPERGTTSFERAFIPRTTTTITGGPAALMGSRAPGSAAKSRKLVKERDWNRDARLTSHSPPSSRNGSSVAGMLARASSKSNGNGNGNGSSSNGNSLRSQVRVEEREAYNSARPRTRTLEENRRERSPSHGQNRNRNRIGSLNMPNSGAEYLASVPASTSPPSAPPIGSLSSPVQSPGDMAGRRSISPTSSAAESMTSTQSAPQRVKKLMKTLEGRACGQVSLRRDRESPWTELYCSISGAVGSLMYEPQGGEGPERTLVSSLKGCTVRRNTEAETLYLEVSLPQTDVEIHFRLLTQAEFDAWFAALLWWQKLDSRTNQANGPRPPSSASATAGRPEPPPRTSSARARDRADSSKSDWRKSVVTSKEAPVIKIGKMIIWDTNVGYGNAPATGPIGRAPTVRPQAYRAQSFGSRRWRRISGQLRENGELKLHSDADNSLICMVQLSQLSRCAIQRLDPSVLENEFCITIYPQYTSHSTNPQSLFNPPIFLTLENRVLYEVWFVLLRAFTIPQLYGPPSATKAASVAGLEAESNEVEEGQDLENMLATTTTDMFRMERTMYVRIVEAKLYPPTMNPPPPDTGFTGGYSRGAQTIGKPEQHGYYAEVILDNEIRAKTSVKFEGLTPLWGEPFEFLDLPPVLNSASVVIKRRPPDHVYAREQQESKLVHEAYGLGGEQHGGFAGLTFDQPCGKVEIILQELEEEKEVEKWWPVINNNQRVGEMLIKTRTDEGVILMERDYLPLSELLHRFSNGITLHIAQMVPTELKRLSDCLLNIYQVSGKVSDWLMALVEDEIDGIHKETPISKLRYSNRIGSDASHDPLGTGAGNSDRELLVRDFHKNATLEANLLFRGNTLLTKSLDTHMRRVGKEYLEECLGPKIKEINDKEPECEVDPNRVASPQELDRNWRRLLIFTQEVWKCIVASKNKCPVELRVIFRHVRACAEDRYGDFLRSVSYSSVSGFLFLRFFCPAVLNPKLFGLLKDDLKPRARRTFTLIAKSLQTLSNMASFGAKETWMEPMNAFLHQNRESFKSFIDDMCYVPTPLSASTYTSSAGSSPTYPIGLISADTHLSYTTPMTIMQRLPPTSREGFPSLPYLIDQARAFAELVQLWLEATTAMSTASETTASAKSHAEVMAAIKASEGDLMAFHEICTTLHKRTQECLNRAERAERPNSVLSFQWEELLDQLQPDNNVELENELQTSSMDTLAETVAGDPSITSSTAQPNPFTSREWNVIPDDNDENFGTRLYDTTPSHSSSQVPYDFGSTRDRPGSSGVVSNLHDSLRRAQVESRGSNADSPSHSMSASASASNVSSAVSSDTEHTTGTTALPSYDRELLHRERREAAKREIQQKVKESQLREKEKERRKVKTPIVSALRRKKERESRGSSGGPAETGLGGYASHG